ncbi:MAG TPA: 5-dehydro-4-deoxyglucarate dehydratase [Steroidobacteraceae bacterium]|jgi:5-dehydro-4-deoxyglucarate dehydratase|nr:5-dehydro-4-deoxyglucarate dehydratase [Steroidobacteraceae bacterium]
MLAPHVLGQRIAEGIMAFPATAFRADLSFDQTRYEAHVAHLAQHGPTALVAAGGAGEIFSLTSSEHEQVVRATVRQANGVPVIGGAGYGTAMACEMARAVERAGADAILLFPPYLVRAEQQGLLEHIRTVSASVSIAVIPYSRDNAVISPETMLRLADLCPNVVALKDGMGNIAGVREILARGGNRLSIVNGAPTAEVLAPQFKTAGVQSYSSAVFTFLPAVARGYFDALKSGDDAKVKTMLSEFYMPLVAIRDRKHGYSVSIVKAGLRVTGASAGPVRAPLTDLTADEEAMLAALVDKAARWSG